MFVDDCLIKTSCIVVVNLISARFSSASEFMPFSSSGSWAVISHFLFYVKHLPSFDLFRKVNNLK